MRSETKKGGLLKKGFVVTMVLSGMRRDGNNYIGEGFTFKM